MGDLMSVQVKKGQVRKEPAFLSAVTKRLSYGQTVSVLKKEDGWIKVKATKGGSIGWMHSSALTSKKIVLNPKTSDVKKAVSSDEYALAGKGFSKEVENEYKVKNPNLNFAWINKMETFNVSQKQMKQFITQGKVVSQGGKA